MHIIFCQKLSMIIIYSSISDIFHSFFQFCPVSSSFVRTKLEEIVFFHFFPGVPEEIGFFRKKPNPAILYSRNIRCKKNIHWNLFPHFGPTWYINTNYRFPVSDVVFVTTDFYFIFFFHMSHNDKILIIKQVFIVVWSISSLGPFCWRVFSDCAITWEPCGMTKLRQANVGNYMKKNNTFDFHILPEHRRIDGKKFSWRCISIKTAIIHEVGVDPFTLLCLISIPHRMIVMRYQIYDLDKHTPSYKVTTCH